MTTVKYNKKSAKIDYRLCVITIFLFCCASLQAQVTTTPWVPICRSIDYSTGQSTSPLQAVYALRIDLSDPAVKAFATPSNGPGPLETDGQRTSAFLEQYNLDIAVNANFFSPCCSAVSGEPKDLLGLGISNGSVVSPPATDRGYVVLTFGTDNSAAIISSDEYFDTAGVYNAVAGSPLLLSNGNFMVSPGGTVHPRTAAGLSQDKRYLYLIVIDGRQPGYSDGATYYETAQWLYWCGAYDGVNLDGGGSSTMAANDGYGNAVILNIPSDAAGERVIGNHLGIYVEPLPIILTQPVGQSVFAGETAVFSVAATNADDYAWYKSQDAACDTAGDDIYLSDANAVVLTDAQAYDQGYYYCRLSNNNGTTCTDVVELTVKRLISHWSLDNNVYDSVSGYDGTCIITPVYVSGVLDVAKAFTGNADERVTVGYEPDLSTNSFTIAAFAKVTGGSGSYRCLMSTRDAVGTAVQGYVIYAANSDKWSFWTGNGQTVSWTKVDGPNIVEGQWVFITATYDYAAGEQSLYIDGLCYDSTIADDYVPGGVDLFIGAAGHMPADGNGYYGFIGDVDEVYCCNYPMSEYEVAQLYADITGRPVCPGPVENDYTDDCRVDFADYAVFADSWFYDSNLDFTDLAIFINSWLDNSLVFPQ